MSLYDEAQRVLNNMIDSVTLMAKRSDKSCYAEALDIIGVASGSRVVSQESSHKLGCVVAPIANQIKTYESILKCDVWEKTPLLTVFADRMRVILTNG